MVDQNDYQLNYQSLTFEDTLRKFRMAHLVNYIKSITSNRILEIGCGNDPLFGYFNDFEKMDIVEPGNLFYENTKSKINNDTRISIVNSSIEEAVNQLNNDYDVIVIGGFLHEIDNPDEVLNLIKKCANQDTVVLTFVPNADSFHRVLALEAGLIKTNFEFSDNDKKFGRRTVFSIQSFSELFQSVGYDVLKVDTYFIKPFAHEQMKLDIFTDKILEGLNKMTKYIPNMGCEIFLAAKKNNKSN